MKFTAFELNVIYSLLTGNDIYDSLELEKISDKIHDFLETIDFNIELNLFEPEKLEKDVITYDPQRG